MSTNSLCQILVVRVALLSLVFLQVAHVILVAPQNPSLILSRRMLRSGIEFPTTHLLHLLLHVS